jgi:hypothetical protein
LASHETRAFKAGAADQGAYEVRCAPNSGAMADLIRGPSWAQKRKSRPGPGQQHDLTAESAGIDAGVGLARGRERQTVDNYGMDSAVAK